MKFVIVTGMSGAGRSTANEDDGRYRVFCIDNLPIQLLDKLIDFSNSFHSDIKKVAVGIDVRNGSGFEDIPNNFKGIKGKKFPYEILFLDAEDEAICKKIQGNKEKPPVGRSRTHQYGNSARTQKNGIFKSNADYIIDTSQLLTRELKTELEKIFVDNQDYKNLFITILSFDSNMAYLQIRI